MAGEALGRMHAASVTFGHFRRNALGVEDWRPLLRYSDGNPLTGNFMDYALPRAEDLPDIEVDLIEIPCETNPMGVKGAGEAGAVGSPPALINAVVDALAGAAIPAGTNPIAYLLQHDWRGVDVQTAETMAFMTLSLCELFRAYTVRSERASVFTIGIFSNKYMQYAVGLSIFLLVLVVSVPFLQPIFNTHLPSLQEWLVVLGLSLVPAIAEEVTKFFLRRSEA